MSARIYRNLVVEEVSLVDEGASGDGGQFRPLIHLKKRKSPMLDFSQITDVKKRGIAQAALRTAIQKTMDGEELKGASLDMILEALPDDAMREALLALIEQLREPAPEAPAETEMSEGKADGEEEEEKAEDEEEESEKAEDEEEEEKSEKSEKAKAAEVAKENARLRKENAALKRSKDIAKKKTEVEGMGVPGDLDALASAMLEMEAVCGESTVATLSKMARAYGALVKGAGSTPAGSSDSGETAGDAHAELAGLVAKKREQKPSLTAEQAEREVYRENKGLYQRVTQAK